MCLIRLTQSFRFASILLLFVACQTRNLRLNEMGAPVTQKQQSLALQATERLREQWNSSACQAIYEQAASPFHSQSLPEWLSQCEYFHPQWGTWQKFILREATTCGEPAKSTVCLLGLADFRTGRYDVIIGWMLENQQARLLYWSLGQNDRQIQTMPSPSKNLFDPPLRPNRQRRDGAQG